MRFGLLLAATVVAMASPVLAQVDLTRASKGYTYFHRAGADMAGHDAAVLGCVEETARTAQADPHSEGPEMGLAGAVLTPLLTGPIVKGLNADADAANIENCMVVRGWEVVSVDPAEGAALSKLDLDAQRAAITPWVGSDPVHGRVVRRFANDLGQASTKYDGRAGGSGTLSFSIAAVGKMPDPMRGRVPRPAYHVLVREGRVGEPLADLSAVGPDETLIVIRTVSTGANDFTGIHFGRPGEAIPGQPYRIVAHSPVSTIWGKQTEVLYVFRVPAGRWRMEKLRSRVSMQTSVSLCLGSPGFDLKKGEAIFAGTFSFKGEGRFVPSMDMAAVRGMLASNPALAARLKPASWINGTRAQCGQDSYIYGLEMPGAPFETTPEY